MTSTARERAKAQRFEALLQGAARLFAAHGFAAVSLEELGAEAGISGPAIYRHVTGKQALLGALLIRVSDDLRRGGAEVASQTTAGLERMRALIAFHVDFALGNPDVIRVQDRDAAHLSAGDHAKVRRLQREYIALWMQTLSVLCAAGEDELRLRVQAAFGLLNSTPHSTRASTRSDSATAQVLAAMAESALLAPR